VKLNCIELQQFEKEQEPYGANTIVRQKHRKYNNMKSVLSQNNYHFTLTQPGMGFFWKSQSWGA